MLRLTTVCIYVKTMPVISAICMLYLSVWPDVVRGSCISPLGCWFSDSTQLASGVHCILIGLILFFIKFVVVFVVAGVIYVRRDVCTRMYVCVYVCNYNNASNDNNLCILLLTQSLGHVF